MSSVATNLLKSTEINPILCAATLCYFERTRNGCLATNFSLLGSTEQSSATSSYVVILERFGQNEESAGSNKERASIKPSLVRKLDLNDAKVFPNMYLCFPLFFWCNY